MNTAGWTISVIAVLIVVAIALRESRHRRAPRTGRRSR